MKYADYSKKGKAAVKAAARNASRKAKREKQRKRKALQAREERLDEQVRDRCSGEFSLEKEESIVFGVRLLEPKQERLEYGVIELDEKILTCKS